MGKVKTEAERETYLRKVVVQKNGVYAHLLRMLGASHETACRLVVEDPEFLAAGMEHHPIATKRLTEYVRVYRTSKTVNG
jgi:hypothetical protein